MLAVGSPGRRRHARAAARATRPDEPAVKPAPFDYVRPRVAPATRWRPWPANPGAKVLAGGQSLVPLLSMRLAAPPRPGRHQRRCPASTTSRSTATTGVRIGALARHADVLASPEVRRVQPLVALALAHVAHATIRNRGTTVGSIVHADAAAEMPMVLALLGGLGRRAPRSRGTRTIAGRRPVRRARWSPSLRHDEIAAAAFFPALAAGAGVGFEEIARRHGDYALCGVGAVVRVDGDAVVSARAGYLSVARRPDRGRPDRGAGRRRHRRRRSRGGEPRSRSSTPPTTSTPPPPTAPSWCACSPRRVLRAAYDDARRRAGGRQRDA